MFRPNGGDGLGYWYVWYSATNTMGGWQFGLPADIPGAADFTGDGKADLGLYRPGDGVFHILDVAANLWTYHPTGVTNLGCGSEPLLCVVPSDYDGDGRADPAVFNSTSAAWTIRYSTTGSTAATTWGTAGASGCTGGNCAGIRPVHNDYDGDGKTDLAVFDNASSATWKIRRSSDLSTRTETFGTTSDIPVPAYYRR